MERSTENRSHFETDKAYWHGFLDFYLPFFQVLKQKSYGLDILEFGVFRGDSIRFYLDYFPNSEVDGVDIVEKQEEWPQSSRVRYFQCDQGQRDQVSSLRSKLKSTYDLIVEDGGHRPDQQYNCLVETVGLVKSGGYYILEDLHTSLPHSGWNKSPKTSEPFSGNCYHFLILADHLKRISASTSLLKEKAVRFCSKSDLFNEKDFFYLISKIDKIEIYRRNLAPTYCWSCRSSDFDYSSLRCVCGIELMKSDDSMTAVIQIL